MSDKLKRRRLGRAKQPRASDEQVEKQLAYVAEVSKNARTTWFGLIALMLFCGVTLLDVEDRGFFEYGASTQLPLINVSVPTENFFWAAPLLVTGLYTYLHLYLDKLWRALARLDDEIEDRPVTEVVYPWLISDTALEMRRGIERGRYWTLKRMATLSLCWFVGPSVMILFWIKSWAAHENLMTLLIGAQLAWLLILAALSWEALCFGVTTKPNFWGGSRTFIAKLFGILIVLVAVTIGLVGTKGMGLWGLYQASLFRASFVKPNEDWKSLDAAWRAYQRENSQISDISD